MALKPFKTRLVRPEGVGTWTFAPIPKELSAREGFRSHQRMKGLIDGAPFHSSLMPRGGGVFFVVVPQALREAIGKSSGDTVTVSLEPDSAPGVFKIPHELRKIFASSAKAGRAFDGLAPSHRKAFAQWVASAKQAETRLRRAEKAREMLLAGKRLN